MPVLFLDCHLPHNAPHVPSRYNNEQTTKQTKAINNSYIYIHISCKCDTNRAGHFTLDAYASRPVACLYSEDATNTKYINVSYIARMIHFPITMMTSSRNIFRVTGPLWGESIGRQWIPLTKTSHVDLWCFLWLCKQSRYLDTHTRTFTRTHTHAHTQTQTHTHTTLKWGVNKKFINNEAQWENTICTWCITTAS